MWQQTDRGKCCYLVVILVLDVSSEMLQTLVFRVTWNRNPKMNHVKSVSSYQPTRWSPKSLFFWGGNFKQRIVNNTDPNRSTSVKQQRSSDSWEWEPRAADTPHMHMHTSYKQRDTSDGSSHSSFRELQEESWARQGLKRIFILISSLPV
jgi:hypothetical protein